MVAPTKKGATHRAGAPGPAGGRRRARGGAGAGEDGEAARRARDAPGRAGRQVAILQDLPGPKLRIGKLRDGVVEFKPGDETTFVCGPDVGEGDASKLFITYAGRASPVDRAEIRYLADGSVRRRVTSVRAEAGEIDAV